MACKKMKTELERLIEEIENWERKQQMKMEREKEIKTPMFIFNERISEKKFTETFDGIGIW
jgi:hypothetical protein